MPAVSIEPVIIPRSQHPISRKWISPNALRVLYKLKESGFKAYLVGGGVRDLLLGREPKDFDIATDATPNEVKRIFRSCRLIGRRFRLAHIHFQDEIIEVATFRALAAETEAEGVSPDAPGDGGRVVPVEPLPSDAGPSAGAASPEDAASPEQAPSGGKRPRPPRMLKTEDGMILRDNVWGTAEDDALRRDFTVNALFYNIADYSVIDYTGGMDDIRRGLIRIIGDPVVRFTEDPVRMVRAVRFAAMLGFEIEPATERALLDLKDRVGLANASRMYEEVQKLFLLGEGEKTFQMLRRTGLFGVMFPLINAWLDTEEEGYPHVRAGKALEWIDTCVQSGRKMEPAFLFALMFGQYIEEKWRRVQAENMNAAEALDQAVAEFLGEVVPRVQLPRKTALAIRDILWLQTRFERNRGKYPLVMLRRPGFIEAFDYLRFSNTLNGDRDELVAWWRDFLKQNEKELAAAGKPRERRQPAPKEQPKKDETAAGGAKRRRRRRGGRRRSGAPHA